MTSTERQWLKSLIDQIRRETVEYISEQPKRRWKYTKNFCRYCGRHRVKDGVCKDHRDLVLLDRDVRCRG